MKKTIMLLLILTMLMGMLSGCAGTNHSEPSTAEQNPAPTETVSEEDTTQATEPSTTEATPSAGSLLYEDYMEWLKDYAEKEKFLGVTNLSQSNVAGKPNSITCSCDYDEGLISLNISTEDGKVAYILSTTSPYTFIDNGVCSNMSDAQMVAYSLALEPIVGINEKWDHSWHLQQFIDAPEQGSSASIMRTYTKDNWSFTVIIGDAAVSVSALNNSIS